jgi:hypothetical protein
LNKWLLATHLLCASKKGITAHQLWRMLGFTPFVLAPIILCAASRRCLKANLRNFLTR